MEQQYMNQMDMYEEEINLKALIIAVLRKWRGIVVTAVVFALLLGGYKGITGFQNLQDPEYLKEQTETVEEAQEQYETQKAIYENQLHNLEDEVQTLDAYREKSIYMNIDPYNEYRETVTYYVNTNYQIMPGMDYQNINQATSILNAYTRRVQDFDIYGKTMNLINKQVSIADIRELVQVQQDNANYMFTVTIVGSDEEIPSILMETIRNTVAESKKEIEASIGPHTIQEVTFTSGYTVDTVLSDAKIRFQDNITKLHNAIAGKQKAITELKKPSGEVPSKKGALKQIIKFAFIGGFGGGFLAALWTCVVFLMGGRMPDEQALKERYGIRTIGTYWPKEKKGAFSFVDGWIDRLAGIRKNERDEEHVYRLAAANLDACTGEGKHVLLAGTISAENLHHLYEKLCGYAEQKNYIIQEGGDLAEDAEAIRKLASSDAVVFAENQLKSRRGQFDKELELVRAQKKEVLGIIMLNL